MVILAAIAVGMANLLDRVSVAYVCMKGIRGTGTCTTRDSAEEAGLEQLGSSTLTVLMIVAICLIAICAGTLYYVKRDGYGPRPTRDDYDTRRPEP